MIKCREMGKRLVWDVDVLKLMTVTIKGLKNIRDEAPWKQSDLV